MNTTSVSLLQRLRQPDAQPAWERFVDLYTPLIFFWAVRAGLPAQDARDLVQKVFASLVQKLPEFDPAREKSFRGWLRALTLDHWRARGAGTTPEAADAMWEVEYRQYVVGQALELMQAEFDARTWHLFWAVTVENRPAAEVAATLGVTANAVYNAKHRVMRRLRAELAGLLQ